MAMSTPKKEKQKKKFEMPHILIIIAVVVVFVCILSYIAPTGQFDLDEKGNVIPGTYHAVERSTVNPWEALLMVKRGIENAASIISLMLVSGGAVTCIAASGAINDILDYAVYKLADKSVSVLVPSIVVLMGALGAFAGTDSMIVFVSVGLVICKRLRLDRICAMAMFYLGYVVGLGASFTGMYVIQSMAGVEPMTGMGVRFIMWVIFVGLNAWWCTRYAKKITKDPSKSLCGEMLQPDADMADFEAKPFPLRGILVVFTLFALYGFYAIANRKWGWDQSYLLALQIILGFAAFAIYGKKMNDASKTFVKGACSMGGICLIMGCARVIGFVLTESNVMHTIANAAANAISGRGLAMAGAGLFLFTLILNLFIPSRNSKSAVMFPVLTPIGDICGLTRQVVAIAYQYGDFVTNCLTPMSGPLVGALGIAEIDYGKWFKYAAPLMAIYTVISFIAVAILASMGFVGA